MSVADDPVPKSTGEIITDAVDALRRSFGVAFPLALPFCAVHLVLWEVAIHVLHQLGALVPTLATADPLTQATILPRLLATLGAFAAGFFVQQLASGAATVLGARLFAGATPTVGDALGALGHRGIALLFTSALFLLGIVGLPTLAALVPLGLGLAGVTLDVGALRVVGIGLLPVVLLGVGVSLALRWYLFNVVVMTEDRSGLAALGRSTAITAPRGLPFLQTPRLRLSVLFLMSLVLTSVVQLLFVIPRLAFAALVGVDAPGGAVSMSLAALPLWLLVPFGLLEVVTNAVVIPFVAYLLCAFTVDLRVRYGDVDEPSPR